MKKEKLIHPLKPIYNKESLILILGSFPSQKSREAMFYYAHPQNQFWKIMSDLFQIDIVDKTKFLIQHKIALWDVIKSCEIKGSYDSSIQNVVVNDIETLLKKSKVKTIFTTGKKATSLYQKHIYPKTKIPCIYLPSSSPLYSKMSYDEKKKEYEKILSYLK